MYAYANEQIASGATGLSVYEDTYILINQVPGTNWMAVAYVSRSEVLEELKNLTVTLLAVELLSIVVLILLVVFQVRRII